VLVTNHVLVGALLGAAIGHPAPAVVAGIASHPVLDTLPHWGHPASRAEFLTVAVVDGLCGLAVVAGTAVLAPPSRRAAAVAGALGGALPDLDKPWKEVFGGSPFPRAFDRFHMRIQNEDHGRMYVDVLTAAALAALGSALAHRLSARLLSARRLSVGGSVV
jgi:hypothetical protein